MSIWDAYGKDKGEWKLAKAEAVVDGSFDRLQQFGITIVPLAGENRGIEAYAGFFQGRSRYGFADVQKYLDDIQREFDTQNGGNDGDDY